MELLHSVLYDIRHGFRLLVRRAGFFTIAALTLAVGLGTMTVAFSAVNAFFLADPPIDTAGAGLIVLRERGAESNGASRREFEAIVRDVPALDVCAQTSVTLSGRRDGGAQTVWGLAVTDNYFDVMGTRAAMGRTFATGDEMSAVVSHRFWRDELAGAPLAGLTVGLNRVDVPVLGVLPRDFQAGFYDAQIWVRIADWESLRLPARGRRVDVPMLTLLGRLRPGATDALADRQLQGVMTDLARAWPASNARREASFVTFEEGLPEMRLLATVAMIAMAMISVVLVIALFNVMGLLLARAVDREREMSLRAALGATRGRLTRQFVTESLMIAAVGGTLALLFSRWSNNLLATFAPETPMPQRIDVTPYGTVAAFTVALMILCGVGAGWWPARRATRLALVSALAPPGVVGSARTGRIRAGIVSIQIAGATLLLTLAALLARHAVLAAAVDVGFEADRTLTLELDAASYGYREAAAQRALDDLVATLRTLPGVVSGTMTDRLPFYVGFPARVPVGVDGRPCAPGECPAAGSYRVAANYFRTMNIPIRQGREFDGSASDLQSVVVSDTLVRQLLPGRDPVGQWLSLGADGRRMQIIGVAADIVHRVATEPREPYVYFPLEEGAFAQPVSIVIRTAGTPAPLLPIVAERVRAMDASLPIHQLRTMRDRIDARQQSGAFVVAKFFVICGGLALFLSTVGLAGTIAYAVGQRAREFGVRAAVGAAPGDLFRLVASGALRMAGPGVAVGLFGALLVSWVIARGITGLEVNSPATFAVVGILQLTVSLVAAAVPGRRAARANPLSTLRPD